LRAHELVDAAPARRKSDLRAVAHAAVRGACAAGGRRLERVGRRTGTAGPGADLCDVALPSRRPAGRLRALEPVDARVGRPKAVMRAVAHAASPRAGAARVR